MPPVDADILPTAPPHGGDLVETAYAKVNLALHVRTRRDDGYHALESLFVFARDGDLLTGRETPDGTVSLTLKGVFASKLDVGPDNLVVRAAHALRNHLGAQRGAALTLTKNLPVASGIGGGSADAAAALRLLDRLWGAQVPLATLEAIALTIGSDVPACLTSRTQLVRGRGEVLEQQEGTGLAGIPMLLANPGVAVSTARVFAGWDQVDRGRLPPVSLNALIRAGRNDLERPAIAAAPEIAEVLALLAECGGVLLHRMSGSGATCFALFDKEADRAAAAAGLRAQRPDWWIMETEIRGA
ncbi:MAG TPA: 4-(cytidine 5'-diphospho)-2-C-methyl-D-erythritol kinase [Sphingobium sp.]|nr:4-(cytidine 5'-diphospho)-2-C-methyl-D-erythritol kinase [Sphingobium sp.]